MPPSCRIIFAGNPNVGKSTVFNALTGLNQHTGNWSGKTVELASGAFRFEDTIFELQDLPGTYSIISNSPEEEIARDAICFGNADYTIVVADATCLARNLNLVLQILEITPRVVLCINLLDEAERKGIFIDLDALKRRLQIPVIGISAKKRQDIKRLKHFLMLQTQHTFSAHTLKPFVTYSLPIENAISVISKELESLSSASFSRRFLALKLLDNNAIAQKLLSSICQDPELRSKINHIVALEKQHLEEVGIDPVTLRDQIVGAMVASAKALSAICTRNLSSSKATAMELRIDKVLTSRRFGIPIIIGFLGILLWITISGANIPSQLLMNFFSWLKPIISQVLSWLHLPVPAINLLVDGVYQTAGWVTAVMLPPMLIFFPLFTLLEDFGYLPRLAFNLDRCFKKAGSCGKQALTMWMVAYLCAKSILSY